MLLMQKAIASFRLGHEIRNFPWPLFSGKPFFSDNFNYKAILKSRKKFQTHVAFPQNSTQSSIGTLFCMRFLMEKPLKALYKYGG